MNIFIHQHMLIATNENKQRNNFTRKNILVKHVSFTLNGCIDMVIENAFWDACFHGQPCKCMCIHD